MGRVIKDLDVAFTRGEVTPKLLAREDIDSYFLGAERLRNLRVLPHGGFAERPGTVHRCGIRRQLTAVSTGGATITAPNGGTAGNLTDASLETYLETTNDLSTTNPFVVWHCDFGTATTVAAVDCYNVYLEDSGARQEEDDLQIQYSSDNSSWTTMGEAFQAVASKFAERRHRRAAFADQSTISRRYWRLARIGATSIAKHVLVGGLAFWNHSASLSAVRLIPHVYSVDATYVLIVTDRNIDVYHVQAAAITASVYIPHTSAQLAETNYTVRLDTAFLFHKDVQPIKVQRRDMLSDKWDSFHQEFTLVPDVDYGAGTGGQNAKFYVDIFNVADGETYWIELDGYKTGEITKSSTGSTNVTRIDNAIGALENVGGTANVVVSTDAGTGQYEIEMVNDAGNRPWLSFQIFAVDPDSTVFGEEAVEGKFPGEPIMSSTRGWPQCGTFWQGRFWLGGFAQRPDSVIASQPGQLFRFDDKLAEDANGFLISADAEDSGEVHNLIGVDHLMVMTSTGEFYVIPNDDSITPGNVSMKRAPTNFGSHGPGLQAKAKDGVLYFLQRDQSALREMVYSTELSNYTAESISILASHLIVTPHDLAIWSTVEDTDADLVMLVNSDGTIAVLHTLRSQDVTAWALWSTDGEFEALAGVLDNMFVATTRNINGTNVMFLEQFQEGVYTDCSVVYSSGSGASPNNFTGLSHLNGEATDYYDEAADYRETNTVSAGAVSVAVASWTTPHIGLRWPSLDADGALVLMRDMPLKIRQLPDGTILNDKKRIFKHEIMWRETSPGPYIKANGKTAHQVSFPTTGVQDTTTERPGVLGYSEEGQLEITRRDTGPLQVIAVKKSVTF